MLIAIVQEQPANAESLKSHLTVGESIFADENRDALEGFGHQKRFIAGLLR